MDIIPKIRREIAYRPSTGVAMVRALPGTAFAQDTDEAADQSDRNAPIVVIGTKEVPAFPSGRPS